MNIKLVAILFLMVSALGAGCATKSSVTVPLAKEVQPIATVSETQEKSLMSFDSLLIPMEAEEFGAMTATYDRDDCVGMLNGDTKYGDLLYTLSVDDDMRSVLPLRALTKEYVRGLHDTIYRVSSKQFYAFYVCHLDEHTDVLAGDFWPHDWNVREAMSPEFMKTFYKTHSVDELPKPESKLIIIQDQNIYEYDGFDFTTMKGIPLQNSTATGGETAPCNAQLEQGKLAWKCFMGLNFETQRANYGTWMFELNKHGFTTVTGSQSVGSMYGDESRNP